MADPQTRDPAIARAAYWISRKRSGEMSDAEAREFTVWLERDGAHRAAFDDAQAVWQAAAAVVDDPALINARARDARRFDNHARARKAGLVAAGLFLAAAGGWALANGAPLSGLSALLASPPQEVRTAIGQRSTVAMRDNSLVTLDTNTVVRLRETPFQRRVELVRGRAHFEVAKDRGRPFIVAAAGRTVRATGTAFDVRVDADTLEVTLVEGRVHVESADKAGAAAQAADMRAGWRLVARGDEKWRVAPVDIDKETSWRDGFLTFARDPLRAAVAEMNRYSEKKIVLNADVPDAAVVGIFKTGDVDGFADAIALNKLARVRARSEQMIELGAP